MTSYPEVLELALDLPGIDINNEEVAVRNFITIMLCLFFKAFTLLYFNLTWVMFCSFLYMPL